MLGDLTKLTFSGLYMDFVVAHSLVWLTRLSCTLSVWQTNQSIHQNQVQHVSPCKCKSFPWRDLGIPQVRQVGCNYDRSPGGTSVVCVGGLFLSPRFSPACVKHRALESPSRPFMTLDHRHQDTKSGLRHGEPRHRTDSTQTRADDDSPPIQERDQLHNLKPGFARHELHT